MIPSKIPLDPGNDQARQWLADELAKGRYVPGFDVWGWLERMLSRLQVTQVGGVSLPGWVVPLVATVVVVTALILVLRAGDSELRRRPRKSGSFVDDATLTAADYRRLSAEAEAAGDWNVVALQSFRAFAVSAVERALLEERPGRTAHEAVVDLRQVFPSHRERMDDAAEVFDLVRYGDGTATRESALAVRELDDELRRTRPVLAEVAAG